MNIQNTRRLDVDGQAVLNEAVDRLQPCPEPGPQRARHLRFRPSAWASMLTGCVTGRQRQHQHRLGRISATQRQRQAWLFDPDSAPPPTTGLMIRGLSLQRLLPGSEVRAQVEGSTSSKWRAWSLMDIAELRPASRPSSVYASGLGINRQMGRWRSLHVFF
jgi:hypothetical protein